MARSSGGRSGGGFSRPRPAPKKKPAPTPPPAQTPARAPAPAPLQSGGGLGSVVAEGMAFGGGSAIAHRAVDAVVGPRVIHHETVTSTAPAAATSFENNIGSSDACSGPYKAFQDCLDGSVNDISRCQFYMDMLAECRKGLSGSGGLTA